ncbi:MULTISPECIES: hypothetical protein [Planktothricoides]|uniref:Uncharacterized protein n=2 Tax=Planktothricoides raciborskii TaxID=132608 RepID=A0AAU8JKX1_9CYAN|nr:MULTISPECIES: hypothetical protein [Planktothricoides]MBD2546201.1 hypothetical protein [Planktothricoides raciborskii FACHB-1370]MBD2584474.1 hypothetical protein [Planktothricoides raciborskii FACHB-1261]
MAIRPYKCRNASPLQMLCGLLAEKIAVNQNLSPNLGLERSLTQDIRVIISFSATIKFPVSLVHLNFIFTYRVIFSTSTKETQGFLS